MVAWPAALGMAALALPLVLCALRGEMAGGGGASGLRRRLGRTRLAGQHAGSRLQVRSGARGCSRPPGSCRSRSSSRPSGSPLPMASPRWPRRRSPRRRCRSRCSGPSSAAWLGIPWYAAFTAGAPALGLSAPRPPCCTRWRPRASPGAALAVGIPLGGAFYMLLLQRLSPDSFRALARPLLELRRRTVATGLGYCSDVARAPVAPAAAPSARGRALRARPGPSIPRRGARTAPPARGAGRSGASGTGLDAARPGEQLYVRGGTYAERVE